MITSQTHIERHAQCRNMWRLHDAMEVYTQKLENFEDCALIKLLQKTALHEDMSATMGKDDPSYATVI